MSTNSNLVSSPSLRRGFRAWLGVLASVSAVVGCAAAPAEEATAGLDVEADDSGDEAVGSSSQAATSACAAWANDATTGQKCPIKAPCSADAECGTQVNAKYWYCKPTTHVCEYLPQTISSNGYVAATGTCTGQFVFRQLKNGPWTKRVTPPDGVNYPQATSLAFEITNTTASTIDIREFPVSVELSGTAALATDVYSVNMYESGAVSDYGDATGMAYTGGSLVDPFVSSTTAPIRAITSFGRLNPGQTRRYVLNLAFPASKTNLAGRGYRLRMNSLSSIKGRIGSGAETAYTACTVPTAPVVGAWIRFRKP